ncbi:MAG: hypothetical protein JWL67_1474 [Solirubrobacterales bacterium]|jgi:anti-sigma regulatory factor (Ser/Thr protein kinase)|nr:hypothetical protein [Solirubrobacterales bacterium]
MTDTRRFRYEPEAVTAARRFVREVLSDQSPQTVEAAELMTSELATNCVRHARTGFEVTIRSRGEIRIEVRDTGGGQPTRLSPEPRAPSGRGLLIVEALSDSWGVIPSSEGKTVWFTVARSGASGEAPRATASIGGRFDEAKRDSTAGGGLEKRVRRRRWGKATQGPKQLRAECGRNARGYHRVAVSRGRITQQA